MTLVRLCGFHLGQRSTQQLQSAVILIFLGQNSKDHNYCLTFVDIIFAWTRLAIIHMAKCLDLVFPFTARRAVCNGT